MHRHVGYREHRHGTRRHHGRRLRGDTVAIESAVRGENHRGWVRVKIECMEGSVSDMHGEESRKLRTDLEGVSVYRW